MATALDAAKEHLVCPLCKNNFEDPKTIICLHSFCQHCIRGHIIENVKSVSKPNSFQCPICNKATNMAEFIGQRPEDWAAMLPSNEALSNILKALNSVQQASTLQCPRHKEKEVEFFCEEHQMFACSLCSTQQHKSCRSVPNLSEAVSKRKSNIGTFVDDLTAQISETEKVLNNRQDQIELLESKENDIKEEISQMRSQFNEFFSKMEMAVLDKMAEIKHKESGLLQLEINQCHNIVTMATDAMKQINELKEEKNAVHVVEKYDASLQAYEERQDKIGLLLANLSDIKVKYLASRNIDRILNESDIGSLSIGRIASKIAKSSTQTTHIPMPKNLEAIQEDEEDVNEDMFQNTSRSRTSKAEVAMVSPMKSVAASTVSVGTSPDEDSEETDEGEVPKLNLEDLTERSTEPSQRDTVTMIKARFVKEFNTAADKQVECSIEGVAILPSGHIVVTDSVNKCLKLYDESYNFMSMTRFAIPPGDVTVLSEREVIVCLPETQKLKHEKIDFKSKKITAGEILQVGDKCFSLSFSNRKLACCSSSTVYVYQRQGNAWVLDASIDVRVNNLKFVAMDTTAQKIVVTRDGYPNRSIICMDITGVRLWAFTHEEIRLLRGVAFLGNKILAASSDQKNIIQLNSKDGRFDGIVVQGGGLQWPWKLCINQRGDKMILSQSHFKMAANDKCRVQVFRLNKIQIPEQR